MNKYAHTTTEHITNERARAVNDVIRAKSSGLYKVYGSRYLAALAKECNYRDVSAMHVVNGGGFVLTLANGIKKRFPTAKDAGLWMEGTLNDWYAMGVK
jgi:hypothetical protein